MTGVQTCALPIFHKGFKSLNRWFESVALSFTFSSPRIRITWLVIQISPSKYPLLEFGFESVEKGFKSFCCWAAIQTFSRSVIWIAWIMIQITIFLQTYWNWDSYLSLGDSNHYLWILQFALFGIGIRITLIVIQITFIRLILLELRFESLL